LTFVYFCHCDVGDRVYSLFCAHPNLAAKNEATAATAATTAATAAAAGLAAAPIFLMMTTPCTLLSCIVVAPARSINAAADDDAFWSIDRKMQIQLQLSLKSLLAYSMGKTTKNNKGRNECIHVAWH
jgi:hypothetical protein